MTERKDPWMIKFPIGQEAGLTSSVMLVATPDQGTYIVLVHDDDGDESAVLIGESMIPPMDFLGFLSATSVSLTAEGRDVEWFDDEEHREQFLSEIWSLIQLSVTEQN